MKTKRVLASEMVVGSIHDEGGDIDAGHTINNIQFGDDADSLHDRVEMGEGCLFDEELLEIGWFLGLDHIINVDLGK